MNLFDRFILTLYSLALVVISLFVMAAGLNLISSVYIETAIAEMYTSSQVGMIYFAAAAVFFLISLKFLFGSMRGGASRPHTAPSVQRSNEYGNVQITVETLESLATHAARRIRGVRDLKARIAAHENGTAVHMKVAVDGETPIPDLTQQIQQAVKERIETIAGVELTEVTVLVSEVAQPGSGSRVRRVE
ncbi:putative alkaline shock family protein YloU [Aneurinibacillus soli]|uniref:Uncharacterized protein n=1 Tax=Aneurinibacillus soli TaxID=1500254 RepID=A0A0U5AYS7_9BACL|nr:alkaline shock response membrane anchor protein AmaP [Aneurinibacillus soli]PYE63641.1 putative alkaline shock family protein YloU [Aneurinibacillus soli]BAU27426.1 hypothetical protein CB4_01600 [Aneurinibacillus soli]